MYIGKGKKNMALDDLQGEGHEIDSCLVLERLLAHEHHPLDSLNDDTNTSRDVSRDSRDLRMSANSIQSLDSSVRCVCM
jgi:hypothetical protein